MPRDPDYAADPRGPKEKHLFPVEDFLQRPVRVFLADQFRQVFPETVTEIERAADVKTAALPAGNDVNAGRFGNLFV